MEKTSTNVVDDLFKDFVNWEEVDEDSDTEDLFPPDGEECTQLDPEAFQEPFKNEFDLFKKYLRFIKKCGYLKTICNEIGKLKVVCEPYEGTRRTSNSRPVINHLPKLSEVEGQRNNTFLNASSKIKLCYSKEKGRYVTAAADINYGDVLMMDEAFAMYEPPNCKCVGNTTFRCSHCCKTIFKYVPCHLCDITLFCTDHCIQFGWVLNHRWECFGQQTHLWFEDRLSPMALRMLFRGAANGFYIGSKNFQNDYAADTDIYGEEDNYKYIYKLPINLNDTPRKELNQYLEKCARNIVYLREKTNFFHWLLGVHAVKRRLYDVYIIIGGILLRHCMQIVKYMIPIPRKKFFEDFYHAPVENVTPAIFASAAMIKRDCSEANVDYVFNYLGNYLIIKAFKPIKKGEEIVVKKLFPYIPRCTEIICSCERCSSKYNEIKSKYCSMFCPKCSNVLTKIDEDYFCSKCNNNFTLTELVNKLSELKMNYIKTSNTKFVKEYLKSSKQIYDEYNEELIGHYRFVMSVFLETEFKENSVLLLDLFLQVLTIYDKYRLTEHSLQIASFKLNEFVPLTYSRHFMNYYPKTEHERNTAQEIYKHLYKEKEIAEFYYPRIKTLCLDKLNRDLKRVLLREVHKKNRNEQFLPEKLI